MREHGATVTHLTPAMGQILVGGAVAKFPALHHAFFVGDILIRGIADHYKIWLIMSS